MSKRSGFTVIEGPVADALLAHATQIDPDGFFFEVPRDIEREVWPFEEFELARSRVPVEIPEDDLFAGVRRLVP